MPEPIAQCTHRYLHQTIGKDEGTLYPSPLRGRQVQIVHDRRARHTNIDTIQESHHAQDDEHGQDHVLTFHKSIDKRRC